MSSDNPVNVMRRFLIINIAVGYFALAVCDNFYGSGAATDCF